MTDDPVTAATRQLLDQHLERAQSGSEDVFLRSYRDDSFLVMDSGVRRGMDEIRACFRQLQRELPNGRFTYDLRIVEKQIGFVKWTADSDTHVVADGVDSYLIRDGYIYAQTIHYTRLAKGEG